MTTWVRHELPPWERDHGYTAEYGTRTADGSWIVVAKRRITTDPEEARKRRFVTRWCAWLCMPDMRGPGPHLIWTLFAARRLTGAKALVELYLSTKPER